MKEKLDDIRALLRNQTTMALATVDENGQPRSSPLFFISDDDLRLFWFSSRSSAHSVDCAQCPIAAVSVYASARTWQEICGVQLKGSVSVVSDPALRKSIAAQYRERFQLGNVLNFAMSRSALYCLTPEWARYIDNSKGFGYKFELNLNQHPLAQ